jgi:hypothetical protein
MRTSIIGFTLLALLASAAFADQQATTACATRLTPPARKIFDAVLKAKPSHGDLGQSVREQTMALVEAGHLQMSTAPDSAMAAARCLELLR